MINSVKDFRGKIEPPVEKGVLKIERYAQRLTQGYSAYGGSYLWAPDYIHILYLRVSYLDLSVDVSFSGYSINKFLFVFP